MRGEPFAAFRRAQIPHSVGIGAMPGLRIQIVQARSEFLSHTTRINEHQCSAVRENLIQNTAFRHRPNGTGGTVARRSNQRGRIKLITRIRIVPRSGRNISIIHRHNAPAFSKSLHGRRDTTDMRSGPFSIHATDTLLGIHGLQITHVFQRLNHAQIHCRPPTGIHDGNRLPAAQESRRLFRRIHRSG